MRERKINSTEKLLKIIRGEKKDLSPKEKALNSKKGKVKLDLFDPEEEKKIQQVEKAETLKKLQKTIENCKKILEENKIKREALLKELAELEAEPGVITTAEEKVFSIPEETEKEIKKRWQEELENPEMSAEDCIKGEPNLTDFGKDFVRRKENEQKFIEEGKGKAVWAFRYFQGKITANEVLKHLGLFIDQTEDAKKIKKWTEEVTSAYKPIFNKINKKYYTELENFQNKAK
jgi:hypothetical protein